MLRSCFSGVRLPRRPECYAAVMSHAIRTAVPADLERILPHMREFWRFEQLPFDEHQPRRALTELLARAELGRVLLLEAATGGEILGYLVLTFGFSLEHGGRDGLIDELYLGGALRGQGLGTLLIEAALHTCRELGIARVHLEVDHSNPRAHSLYARLGFAGKQRALLTRKLG